MQFVTIEKKIPLLCWVNMNLQIDNDAWNCLKLFMRIISNDATSKFSHVINLQNIISSQFSDFFNSLIEIKDIPLSSNVFLYIQNVFQNYIITNEDSSIFFSFIQFRLFLSNHISTMNNFTIK